LKGLLDGFIDFGQISQRVVLRVKNKRKVFSKNFVKELGNSYVKEKQITGKQLKSFIGVLGREGILSRNS
jgi:hypothetical protein